jgi:hypothetical protein
LQLFDAGELGNDISILRQSLGFTQEKLFKEEHPLDISMNTPMAKRNSAPVFLLSYIPVINYTDRLAGIIIRQAVRFTELDLRGEQYFVMQFPYNPVS